MATLIGYQYALNTNSPVSSGVIGQISSKAANTFSVSYPGGSVEKYFGSFTYLGGQPQGVINSVTVTVNGLPALSISGLSLTTQTMNSYTATGNISGLYAYMFSGNDSITGSTSNDDLDGYAGNDKIFGGLGNDALRGGDGNDYLVGGVGMDTLTGGAGADVLIGGLSLSPIFFDYILGGTGNDTYVFNKGDGVDVIWDTSGSPTEFNQIVFGAGIRPADVMLARVNQGFDLLLSIRGTGDSITVNSHFQENLQMSMGIDPLTGLPISFTGRLDSIDQVKFADGTIWNMAKLDSAASFVGSSIMDYMTGLNSLNDVIYGLAGDDVLSGLGGNDVLIGGLGSDFLDGGDGSDVYVFNRGDGQDSIQDLTVSALPTIDTVKFGAGVLSTDVVVTRKITGLLELTIRGTTDKMVIIGGIEKYSFADGTVWAATQFDTLPFVGYASADSFNGGAQAEIVYGLQGADSLFGNGGNDVLVGGLGNDYLSGGSGNDIYVFNKGDGQDVISNMDASLSGVGLDVVRFGAGILPGGVVVTRVMNDLVLSLSGTADKVTIYNHFSNPDFAIDEIRFADGTVWTATQFNALPMLGTAAADVIVGSLQSDVINGLAGNDIIHGGAGGNDILYGDLGNDTLWGGSGNDQLFGGDGNDLLSGFSGSDIYTGGLGQDIFCVGPNGPSQITDFNVLDDTIQLARAAFAGLGTVPGTLAAGQLLCGAGATAAVTAAEHLIYDSTSGALYYDADANGLAPSVLICTLTAGLPLTNADFVLI